MKNIQSFLFAILLSGTFALTPLTVGAESELAGVSVSGMDYCHLKLPRISEETLFSNSPVLKDPSDGDVVDFYGPCDYDPLGMAEIQRQRREYHRQLRRSGD